MANYATESIRTVALVGHGAAGKTTLAEALLLKAGAIQAPGSVERGTTVSRFRSAREAIPALVATRRSCISRRTARACTSIDTPGFPDFIGAVDRRARCRRDRGGRRQRAVRHRDDHVAHDGRGRRTASCAASSSSTRSTPRTSTRRRCSPRSRARSARNACRSTCPPTAASGWSTASSIRRASRISRRSRPRTRALVDQVVEVDEELMALYLEKGEVEPEQLHAPFEKALREGHLVPVCFVSARTGAGVAELLDDLRQAAAQSEGRQSAAFHERRRRDAQPSSTREPDPSKHVLAHVFKVVMDPVRRQARHLPRAPGHDHARYAALRRRRPQAVQGRTPLHAAGRQERRGRSRDPGRHRGGRESRRRSSSTACCTTRTTRTTSTWQPLEFPTPMHGVAIEPKRRGDEGRISDVLHQHDRGRSDAQARARHQPQRDGAVAAWATCTCARCSSACRASSSSR